MLTYILKTKKYKYLVQTETQLVTWVFYLYAELKSNPGMTEFPVGQVVYFFLFHGSPGKNVKLNTPSNI